MTDFLQLLSLATLSVADEGDRYLVKAQGRSIPAACPQCLGPLHGHGTQLQSFQDAPARGRAVTIEIQRRRFRCQRCGRTLFDAIPDLDARRQITSRLLEYIQRCSFQEPFAAVARRVGLDEKTIRQVFDDHVAELQAKVKFETPRLLGIDELKIVGAHRAMLTNVERQTVFDLRESRNKAELLAYFRDLSGKDKIEWVAMDMYDVYRQVVHKTLPHARMVVDKFHIQRMGNEVLEKMRKRLRKTLPERQRLKLKDERFLLLKRQHDLSDEAMQRLLAWFRQFPELGEAHALKEGFLSIWDQPDRTAAESAYEAWLGNLPETLQPVFKDLTRAMHNWHEEILSYFDNRITNAYTESVNSLTRSINRMGRGYSFSVLRARLLFDPKARKAGTVTVDEPVYYDAPPTVEFMKMLTTKSTVRRTVEYGPHIPKLVELLDAGYFE